MKNHPGVSQHITPLERKMRALFQQIPDDEFISSLKSYYAGRRGYTDRVIWRTILLKLIEGRPSFASLIRYLESNPSVWKVCGIGGPDQIPSKWAYSRFFRKFARQNGVVGVKNVFREMVRRCFNVFPDYGRSVCLDSTHIKGWSNGAKSKTNPADPDCGWTVKTNTDGTPLHCFGYKIHSLVDAATELPIAINLSPGNTGDVTRASNVLSEARFTYSGFHPKYFIADAAYSDKKLRSLVKRQYRAVPIIDPNPRHKRAVAEAAAIPEFKTVKNLRGAVERSFGRAKDHLALDTLTLQGRHKASVHVFAVGILMLAHALAFPDKPRSLTSR